MFHNIREPLSRKQRSHLESKLGDVLYFSRLTFPTPSVTDNKHGALVEHRFDSVRSIESPPRSQKDHLNFTYPISPLTATIII